MTVSKDIKILVVDDNAPMRKILVNILTHAGFKNVTEANDGSTALVKLNNTKTGSKKIDLVLLDWSMPNVTGMSVLKEVKADLHLKDIPVIMVTAESSQENIMAAVKAGASNYIIKPFEPETIISKIDKVFS
ncbi:MAG: response regulator [SAR324 cluster bacterium]|nr:response regulator [SAR324 cluster bacterium]